MFLLSIERGMMLPIKKSGVGSLMMMRQHALVMAASRPLIRIKEVMKTRFMVMGYANQKTLLTPRSRQMTSGFTLIFCTLHALWRINNSISLLIVVVVGKLSPEVALTSLVAQVWQLMGAAGPHMGPTAVRQALFLSFTGFYT